MMEEKKEPQIGLMYKEIEDRLRTLPQPAVPEGLEARLLAGIPARPRRRGYWRYYTGFAAALAAGLVLAFLFRSAGNPSPRHSAEFDLLNNTNPQYILNVSPQTHVKETMPCHILPLS